MRRQILPAWASLARHLRWVEVARDLALLTGIGALASFAALFTSRVLFDNLSHEISLNYASRIEGAQNPAGDLQLLMDDSAVVAPASSRGALHGDEAVNTTVLAFEPGAPVGRWLAGSVLEGSPCDDGIMLDEATVASLGARVGDELTLWWPDLPGQQSGPVRLCGVLKVWHPENSADTRGYLVASTSYLARSTPAFASLPGGKVETYWFSRVPPGAQTKAAAERAIVREQVGWTRPVGIVVLISAALWIFGVVRVWRWLLSGLEIPWRVLDHLGVRPSVSKGFVGAVTLLLALVGGAASAVLARATILGWTNLFITSRQIIVVAALLFLIACGTVVVRGRRLTAAHASAPPSAITTGDPT